MGTAGPSQSSHFTCSFFARQKAIASSSLSASIHSRCRSFRRRRGSKACSRPCAQPPGCAGGIRTFNGASPDLGEARAPAGGAVGQLCAVLDHLKVQRAFRSTTPPCTTALTCAARKPVFGSRSVISLKSPKCTNPTPSFPSTTLAVEGCLPQIGLPSLHTCLCTQSIV